MPRQEDISSDLLAQVTTSKWQSFGPDLERSAIRFKSRSTFEILHDKYLWQLNAAPLQIAEIVLKF